MGAGINAYFSTLRHWGWDLVTRNGKKVANNGNGKGVLLESTDHLKLLLSR